MRAAVVVLADGAVQNYARRIVYALNTRWGVPFYASLLPVHISLKQPFAFEDMAALEDYCDGMAASLRPFEVRLDRLYYTEWNGYAILGINAVETPTLRGLHERLNRELAGLFADTRAPHDGSEYHFHLTVEMGPTGEPNRFKEYFDSLRDKALDLRFTARALGVFFYPQSSGQPQTFIHYRTCQLGAD